MKTNFLRVLFLTFTMLFVHTYSSAQQVINSDLHVSGKLGLGTTSPAEKLHINGFVRGAGSYGALQIRTTTGNMEFGPMDLGYVRFKTNMSTYHFDKRLLLQNGLEEKLNQ